MVCDKDDRGFASQVNPIHSNSKRTYKVRGIKAEGGAAAAMFQNEEAGTRMSVADYFQSQYNYKCAPKASTATIFQT